MTRRLGLYLSIGFVGVVLLLAGLSWDAILHAGDPSLAAREGMFAWRNPGHVLLGLGMGTVITGLLGAASTAMAMSGPGRWGRPWVQRTFLAGSTALVVAAATVTAWSASAVHEGGHGRVDTAAHGQASAPDVAGADAALAAAPAPHGHARPASEERLAGGAARTAPSGPGRALGHHHEERGSALPAGSADAGHRSRMGSGTHPARDAAGDGRHGHGNGADRHTATGRAGASGAGHDPAGHDAEHDGAGQTPGAASPAQPGPGSSTAPVGSGAPAGDPGLGKVATVRWGPFVLPPAGAGGDLDHTNIVLPEGPKPCSDCFVTAVEPDLIYADGTTANLDSGVMLHHAVFFHAGEEDTTCGAGARSDEAFGRLGQRFFASGNERTGGVLPAGFGYRLTDRPVNGLFHIMNHSSEPKTVFFEMTVRWVPASATGMRPVTPVWLDMNNCRTSEYAVPAGHSSSHWTWTSSITGRIVSAGGHVHHGGVRTSLTNATTGQSVCTSWAGYGTDPAYQGSLESMSVCSWDALGSVRAGETLDLETVYHTAEPIPDAMGIMLAYVYETPEVGAGTPPPPEATGDVPAPPSSTPPPSRGGHGHDH